MDEPEIDDEKIKDAVPAILLMLANTLDLNRDEAVSVTGSVLASLIFMKIRKGEANCDMIGLLMNDIHNLVHVALEEIGLESDDHERSEHLSQVIKSLKLENLK